ncbi:MAG TPA: C4-dicarboxylic acid transporter DauA [Thermoanaerobaculia bacterium]|nr:C4-dicarboxylic acid transporter DauA [Thermoanaerobaculia bacterium]
MRRVLARGYGAADLRADLLAGAVVGVVALPLSMALAIASGVPPQHGLYTAIVAGGLVALLGGSRVQVSGPTAAFVAILAPIAARFGVGGLLLATAMAGLILIGFGFGRLGRLIEFVPYPVTTGFTAGIAVVIATLQVKDLLGLSVPAIPEEYLSRLGALVSSLPSVHGPDAAVGALTLALLLLWPRLGRRAGRIPAPLASLALAAVAAALLTRWAPKLAVETIQTRFSYTLDGSVLRGIPRSLPLPVLPWEMPGPAGARLELSFDLFRQLLPSAFAIAVLGAIESLLSAVVADGMIGGKHDPDEELLAQGIGNLVAPFFGGIAATGAIARTATNVRSGARSPFAAVTHAAVVLAAVLLLAPALGYLPMASLAALLLVVAWNMSEARHGLKIIRTAPRSDVLVLLTCFGLTVLFDMVIAITVGVVLAAILFMRRMAEVSGTDLVGESGRVLPEPLPEGAVLYRVAGPLFFGAAHKAAGTLHTVAPGVRAVLFDLRAAPALDATGLVNLESAVERLGKAGVFVALAGLQPQPFRALVRAGWRNRPGEIVLRRSFERGIEAVRQALAPPSPEHSS